MQDYSDNSLDRLIEQSLRLGAALRPGQKQRAWETLQARLLADQTVAVVKPEREAHSPLRAFGRWLVWMCLDESHYERAVRHRLNAYPLALTGEPLGVALWTGRIHRQPI